MASIQVYSESLILYLYTKGYTQKMIQIITGYTSKNVRKTAAMKNKIFIPFQPELTQEQLLRKMIVDKIQKCKPLRKADTLHFNRQDILYMKLLHVCGVPIENIRQLYYKVPQKYITFARQMAPFRLYEFDPFGIEIDEDDWKVFYTQLEKIF